MSGANLSGQEAFARSVRPWLRHVTDEGRKVAALAVYEKSVLIEDPPVVLPPIRVEIIGDARRIKCAYCHHRERGDWEGGIFGAYAEI